MSHKCAAIDLPWYFWTVVVLLLQPEASHENCSLSFSQTPSLLRFHSPTEGCWTHNGFLTGNNVFFPLSCHVHCCVMSLQPHNIKTGRFWRELLNFQYISHRKYFVMFWTMCSVSLVSRSCLSPHFGLVVLKPRGQRQKHVSQLPGRTAAKRYIPNVNLFPIVHYFWPGPMEWHLGRFISCHLHLTSKHTHTPLSIWISVLSISDSVLVTFSKTSLSGVKSKSVIMHSVDVRN